MENLISSLSSLFLESVLLGFFFGLCYEVLRFLRLALPHPDFFVNLEDLLFFLPATVIYLFFLFCEADGVIRWFSLGGVLGGFFLYQNTLGKILIFFSRCILAFFKGVLRFLYRVTVEPVVNVFKNITIFLFTKMKKQVIIRKEKSRLLKLEKQKKSLLKLAEKGFLKRT